MIFIKNIFKQQKFFPLGIFTFISPRTAVRNAYSKMFHTKLFKYKKAAANNLVKIFLVWGRPRLVVASFNVYKNNRFEKLTMRRHST